MQHAGQHRDAARDDRGGRPFRRQRRGGIAESLFGQEARRLDQRGIGLDVARSQGFLVAANAFARRVELRAPGDESDAPVAEVEQVLGGGANAGGVVGRDRVRPGGPVAVDEHDGNVEPAQERVELLGDRGVGPDHHAVRLAAAQAIEELALAVAAAFRIREQEGKARLVQHVVRRAHECRQRRQVDLADHAADGVRGAPAHALRHGIGRIAEFVDRGLDLLP